MTIYEFDGWHKIEKIEVEMKGKTAIREKLHLKSAVAAIVTDKDGKIGLVSQYRPVVDMNTLEIPAGVLDKDHLSNVGILLEELQEECNLSIYDIAPSDISKPVAAFNPVIGSSDAVTEIYRVKLNKIMSDFYKVNDADVEMVYWLKFEAFERLVQSGIIRDGKTMLAYYILKGEQ